MWKLNIEDNEQMEKGRFELRKFDGIVSDIELKMNLGETCYETIKQWVTNKGDVFEFTSTNTQYHLRVERI